MNLPDEYRYDERLEKLSQPEFVKRMKAARGLEKLRFVKDQAIAAQLYELYFVCQRNSRDPRILADIAQREQETAAQKFRDMAHRALQGKLGRTDQERNEARDIANQLMPINPHTGKRQEDPMCMQQLAKALKALREEYTIEPSGGFDEMPAGAQEPAW